MYKDLLLDNLIIREFLNGSLTPLSFNLTIVLTIFLFESYKEGQERGVKWNRIPGVATGCALWWIFGAETIRAGIVWYILREHNDGLPLPVWFEYFSNFAFMVAAFSLIVTMLRCTYIFTPPIWGNRFWIYSAISTAIFLTISHLFPQIHF